MSEADTTGDTVPTNDDPTPLQVSLSQMFNPSQLGALDPPQDALHEDAVARQIRLSLTRALPLLARQVRQDVLAEVDPLLAPATLPFDLNGLLAALEDVAVLNHVRAIVMPQPVEPHHGPRAQRPHSLQTVSQRS